MIALFITYLPAIVGLIVLTLFVLSRSLKTSSVTFSLLLASITLWLSAQFVGYLMAAHSPDSATVFLRLSIFFSNFMPYFFLLFCMTFPDNAALSSRRVMSLVLPVLAFCAITFSGAIISGVSPVPEGVVPQIEAGSFYVLQTVFLMVYIILGIIILITKLKGLRVEQKKQIYTLFLAFIIPIVLNFLINFVLLDVNWVQLFAPPSLLVMAGLITYAIVKQRLFDMKAIVVRSVTYLVFVLTIALVYVFVVLEFGRNLLISSGLEEYANGFYALATLGLAVSYSPIVKRLTKLTDRLFFRDAYDPQEVLDKLSTILADSSRINPMLERASKVLSDALKPRFIIIIPRQTERMKHVHTSLGTHAIDVSQVSELMQNKDETLINAEDVNGNQRKALHTFLVNQNISIVAQLKTRHEVIGYLILGYKESGYLYRQNDIALIRIAGEQLAIAVQNGLRFEEISAFNKTLQTKVDDATTKLRHSNAKLKQLDEAKDDFISMASHQLRTPLTSVKGYLSMVLEGDMGKVSPQQRKVLEEAYTSSQRMVFLIGDFLNVSRLQTGKFELERTPTNLAVILADEIEQLRAMAQGRQLNLSYETPSHFPVIHIDQDKFRQVMMNFIDNAIYYSHSNTEIAISLIKEADDIVFRVTDHGIGVPSSERHKLFTKFYRASNAKKARPDGTGIGLFMAQKVIVAHGGSVIFESKENSGSTFGFRLPLKGNTK